MTALPGPLRSMVFRNEDLPALFHHTDAIAIARQREAVNTTRGQLVLLVLGTVPAALPWHVRTGPVELLDAIGVLAYTGVLVTTFLASRRKAKSHWQLNRSAAEFIKSICWRYAVHGSPFDTAVPHPEAVFANRLEEGLQELRKVGWADPRDEPDGSGDGLITESMRELRDKAFTVRKETYIRDRLIEQRRWYRRRLQVSRRGAFVWSSTIAALTAPALVLGLFQTFGAGRSFALTGTLSAAAAACLAWNEMRRHHPLISAHSLVETDLESMQAAMETTLTERQWPVAVFETERIVSPEHTDWLARHRM
ncbi:DUF4231 domain-containing protein [Streptomyces sp. NPDC079020]|uniref:DUF4231 domain-containing protein n=1 Tax=Streptomyces sp. NPDC079020 TaxID=3365722 RepID=UPI0037D2D9FB